MNKVFIIISATLILFCGQGFQTLAQTGEFVIKFVNVNPNQGMVEASIYNESDKFLVKDKYIQKLRAEVINGKAQIVFKGIPFGKVAVGSYHDVDNDNTYDKTFIGLPSEPYAFSKKPVCSWRKPRFEEVSVDFRSSGQVLYMEFQHFMGD